MATEYEELNEEEASRVHKRFNSFKNKEYSEEDMHKVFDNEENIMGKMGKRKLRSFIDDAKLYFEMLKDFFSKKYPEVPIGTIMAIVGTLLYVLTPVDMVPDYLPFIGYIDDAAIMGLCLRFTKMDLDKYKEYKKIK